MLLLIGLGIGPKEISVRALDALKSCDAILVESYTTPIPTEYLDFIRNEAQKEPVRIGRSSMEEDMSKTLLPAKSLKLAILVPGDPLIATTHHKVLDRARELGIGVSVFHSSSVLSAAIGESGLDAYKFGPTATVPFWSKNYHPVSFIDTIQRNLSNKQHTLVLLDLKAATGTPMSLRDAISLLSSADSERGCGIMSKSRKLLVLGNLGREGQLSLYASVEQISSRAGEFDGKVLCIVVPAEPSFAEEESISCHSPR
jgi:diphthine synthase